MDILLHNLFYNFLSSFKIRLQERFTIPGEQPTIQPPGKAYYSWSKDNHTASRDGLIHLENSRPYSLQRRFTIPGDNHPYSLQKRFSITGEQPTIQPSEKVY